MHWYVYYYFFSLLNNWKNSLKNNFFSDIDECSITTNNVCGNGVCKNIPGDFICECNEGFRTMAPMQVCMGKYKLSSSCKN